MQLALAVTSGGLRLLGLVRPPRAPPGERSVTASITSKPNSISLTPVKAGTLTVETTLPAPGWWNGTTPESIKSGYEYCMAAELANMAGLSSVTVKNVSFDQLVAGHTNDFDLALAEISITPERAKVVDFSKPYFDSNVGVIVKSDADVTEDNITTKRCAAYSGTTSVPLHPGRAEVQRPEDLPRLARRSTRACSPASRTPPSSTPRSCSPRPSRPTVS